MTVFANIRSLHMCQVLTRRCHTVMAADAITDNTDVVESRGSPRNRGMAVVAVIAAGNMSWMLANSDDAIMTRATGSDDLRVVDRKHGRKYVRVVAVLTDIAGLNMRWTLADCFDTVVAVKTRTSNIYMIEIRG